MLYRLNIHRCPFQAATTPLQGGPPLPALVEGHIFTSIDDLYRQKHRFYILTLVA